MGKMVKARKNLCHSIEIEEIYSQYESELKKLSYKKRHKTRPDLPILFKGYSTMQHLE